MKMKIGVLAFSVIFILSACKPKKAVTSTASASSTTPAKPVTNSTAPTETSVSVAKERFPDVTLDVLKKGHAIYYTGACIGCHKPKSIEKRDEKEWVGILDEMSKKADLAPADKDAVWKYIVSVKLLSPSSK